MTATPDALMIQDYLFADDGEVPNNRALPLIVYRGALIIWLVLRAPARA